MLSPLTVKPWRKSLRFLCQAFVRKIYGLFLSTRLEDEVLSNSSINPDLLDSAAATPLLRPDVKPMVDGEEICSGPFDRSTVRSKFAFFASPAKGLTNKLVHCSILKIVKPRLEIVKN